ncbi:Hpt domain-containing protein [Parapedobacter sp. 10938]|uniref:Hpt domain-containing protein n=1 Tax=Parapedobacter flavus TaxID=3110225 RepID=UPI002DBDB4E0|nr:Hpt domain-containing protein [Parapedobacter sp. 10938]MEC3881167.1 Hpt domain-containing protein [Parapedobacter sp. 10938]
MNKMNFEQADLAYLMDLSNGNTQLIREILDLFIKQTPSDMQLLTTYVEQEDWESAYKQAHHIKPTLAYVGANEMRQELQEIEDDAKHRQNVDGIAAKLATMLPKLDVLYGELRAYLKTID